MTALYEYRFTRHRVADVRSRTISGAEGMHAVFAESFADLGVEHLKVAVLNARNTVIGIETVYIGNVTGTTVRIGDLFRAAIRLDGVSIVIAHNHPSGDPTPSPDDLHMTAEAVAAGRLLDIPVRDHIIIADDDWTSLRDRGVAFER